jgi:YVTN family beta-propeller protein
LVSEEWYFGSEKRLARLGTILVALTIAAGAIGFAAVALSRDDLDTAGNGTSLPGPGAPGTVLHEIPVGTSTQAIQTSFGSVWAVSSGSDRVLVIDPTRLVVTDEISVGGLPWDLAAGAGALWVANGGDGTVSRIDPRTKSVAATIDVGGRPTGIATDRRAVWVVTYTGQISRIDPATNTVTSSIQTGASETTKIAAGEGSVWIASSAEGTVTQVDQATGRVVDEPIVVPGHPDVAVASGYLWATSSADGALLWIDASTGNVLDVVPIGEGGPSPIQFSIEVGDGFLWVLGGFESKLLQVDPSSGEIVDQFVVDPSAVDVTVGGSLWLASLGHSVIELQH